MLMPLVKFADTAPTLHSLSAIYGSGASKTLLRAKQGCKGNSSNLWDEFDLRANQLIKRVHFQQAE